VKNRPRQPLLCKLPHIFDIVARLKSAEHAYNISLPYGAGLEVKALALLQIP
jgi:hypothetical protein